MPEPNPNPPNPQPPEEKTHSDKAFRKVSDDMHKYKAGEKAALDRVAELEQQIADKERAEQEKNGQYKKLYEDQLKINSDLKNTLSEKDDKFLKVQKLNAVKEQLGEFKKSEYNKFIDTSKIIIDNDGNVDLTTVENEVNRLKQQYPELLKVQVNSDLPDEAPESGSILTKSVKEMSTDERSAARKRLIQERSKN